MKRHDFPLTRYLCALIDFQMGNCTKERLRERWRAGEFEGVDAKTAAEYAKLHGVN